MIYLLYSYWRFWKTIDIGLWFRVIKTLWLEWYLSRDWVGLTLYFCENYDSWSIISSFIKMVDVVYIMIRKEVFGIRNKVLEVNAMSICFSINRFISSGSWGLNPFALQNKKLRKLTYDCLFAIFFKIS